MSTITQRSSREVVSEVYEDLQPLVEKTAKSFAHKYNRSVDETMAEANLHFLEAYHRYDPSHGTTLQQRVVFIIWNRLFASVRKELKKERRMPFVGPLVEDTTQSPPLQNFDLEEFKADLSEDAETVIDLLMKSPEPLEEAIRTLQRPNTVETKNCVRRYLIDKLQWASKRVKDTFREIREALQ